MIINTDYIVGMKYRNSSETLTILMNNESHDFVGTNIDNLSLIGELAELYIDYIEKEVGIKEVKDCKVCGCDYNKTK